MSSQLAKKRHWQSKVAGLGISVLAVTIMAGSTSFAVTHANTSKPVRLAQAQATVQRFEIAPKVASITTLKKKPTGKVFVFVAGLISAVSSGYDLGIHQACADIGCTIDDLGAATTTALQVSAYSSILAVHPAAVIIYNFNTTALSAPGLAQLGQAGIKVLTITGEPTRTTSSPETDYNVQTNIDKITEGRVLAAWVAATSKCQGNVLIPFTPATAASVAFTNGFQNAYQTTCPGQQVLQLGVLAADIGTNIPPQITAALQAHPNIQYLVGPCPIMTGVNQALITAGLSGKITGALDVGTPACDQELQSPTDYAKVVLDISYQFTGWNAVNAAADLLGGQQPASKVFNGVPYPLMLHTAKNYNPQSTQYDPSSGYWLGNRQNYIKAFTSAWKVKA